MASVPRAPAGPAARHGEPGRYGQPEAGVIGRVGEPSHGMARDGVGVDATAA